jgi:hypothetical protein
MSTAVVVLNHDYLVLPSNRDSAQLLLYSWSNKLYVHVLPGNRDSAQLLLYSWSNKESRLPGNTCTSSLLDHEYSSSCAESRLPGNTCT